MAASIFKPDTNDYVSGSSHTKLFLAGSIEQGKAVDWQQEVTNQFGSYNISIYNPRRSKWNPELEQSITNQQFREQVAWEQKWLESSQYVLMNFVEDTMSPISLLELGQLSRQTNTITVVCCPRSFWRRGNVEVVCVLYKMPLYETLEEAVAHLKTIITK